MTQQKIFRLFPVSSASKLLSGFACGGAARILKKSFGDSPPSGPVDEMPLDSESFTFKADLVNLRGVE
jgi:hypothetical protein